MYVWFWYNEKTPGASSRDLPCQGASSDKASVGLLVYPTLCLSIRSAVVASSIST